MISIDEAFELILHHVQPLSSERLALDGALGRTLYAPIFADVDSPSHAKSVMDGYAVRAQDIGSCKIFRVLETIVAGNVPTMAVGENTASRIMTGAPLPHGADAVVMIEVATELEQNGATLVRFDLQSLEAGRHTMAQAASFSSGASIFTAPRRIRPLDIGLLAEVGAAEVEVYRLPSVAILPTGNELVDAGQRPGAGQIRNSNGPMLWSLLSAAGIESTDLGIGRDAPDELSRLIDNGLQHDLLILSGGVSAGLLDLGPGLLRDAGVEEAFHKVHVKPGKPIWFGTHARAGGTNYVFGLPGNPVSSLVGFELFVRAAIRRMNGWADIRPETVGAVLADAHSARGDRPTWWPGRWIESGQSRRLVRPLPWLGSSDLKPLGEADVLICFPADRHEYHSGDEVQVLPIV